MCLYHVFDNTLVNLIRVLILILILILIQEFIKSTTDNVIIVFTSEYIRVVVVVRISGFVIKSIESTSDKKYAAARRTTIIEKKNSPMPGIEPALELLQIQSPST